MQLRTLIVRSHRRYARQAQRAATLRDRVHATRFARLVRGSQEPARLK
jgi:hypothetical protein